jgi:hypothetical protein
MQRSSTHCRSQLNRDQKFQLIRKTCYLPLSPQQGTASSHSKSSQNRPATPETETQSSRATTRSARLTHHACSRTSLSLPPARLFRISQFLDGEIRARFALRNFDTEPRYLYCYRSEPYDRLESVANAHTAADLHVRPGLTTRWFQGRERCERPKRYDQASFPATKNSPSLPCENNLAFRLIGTRFSRKAARF